jgi:hypothetical protein
VLPHGAGMRYRIVGNRPGPQAQQVEPGLEDGYLALTGATATTRPATQGAG